MELTGIASYLTSLYFVCRPTIADAWVQTCKKRQSYLRTYDAYHPKQTYKLRRTRCPTTANKVCLHVGSCNLYQAKRFGREFAPPIDWKRSQGNDMCMKIRRECSAVVAREAETAVGIECSTKFRRGDTALCEVCHFISILNNMERQIVTRLSAETIGGGLRANVRRTETTAGASRLPQLCGLIISHTPWTDLQCSITPQREKK